MPADLKVFLWGAGGHAKVVADAIRLGDDWLLAGFIDDVAPERAGESFAAGRVLGGREALAGLVRQDVRFGIAAVGDCAARQRLSQEIRRSGFDLAGVTHPSAVVAHSAHVGPGSFIAAAAVVGPDATLGEAVIVNTSASVDHDCVVEDGVHVGPGARLAGGVQVGRGTLVGASAVVLPGVRIAAGCVIGAGAVVTTNVPSGTIAYGNPARAVREESQ